MSMNTKQSGMTLVAVLVAISLFVLFFSLSLDSFWQAEKAIKTQSDAHARLRIFHGLINLIGMPSTLRASAYNAGFASDLGQCVFGLTGTCPNPNQIRDLVLLLPPLTSNGTSAELSGPITGSQASPILYSMDGKACDPTKTNCPLDEFPIAATTQWQAICPPRADVTYFWPNAKWVASDGTSNMNPEGIQIPNYCARAHYIKIHYRFKLAPGAPERFSFKTVVGHVIVSAPAANFSY